LPNTLKIISDGTIAGTRVVDIKTGKPLSGVCSISWRVNARNYPIAVIEFENIPVELDVEVERCVVDV